MSSGGTLARNRALSLGSGRSSNGRKGSIDAISTPTPPQTRAFEPCDATASMFLYAQGTTVVVAHHDTLAIERRFSRHKEEVTILAVDNFSERGAGRLVISYDAGQTAIVWDLMTGDEVTRFASYNSLSVAAWMRNGNVAFGGFVVPNLRRKRTTDIRQATHREMLYFSNHRHRNIFQREPSIKCRLLLSRQRQTAEHTQLGTHKIIV